MNWLRYRTLIEKSSYGPGVPGRCESNRFIFIFIHFVISFCRHISFLNHSASIFVVVCQRNISCEYIITRTSVQLSTDICVVSVRQRWMTGPVRLFSKLFFLSQRTEELKWANNRVGFSKVLSLDFTDLGHSFFSSVVVCAVVFGDWTKFPGKHASNE